MILLLCAKIVRIFLTVRLAKLKPPLYNYKYTFKFLIESTLNDKGANRMYDMIKRTACFSGHRISRLPKGAAGMRELSAQLQLCVSHAIQDGYDSFLYGGCQGFDLLAADAVLSEKRMGAPVRLIAVIPFPEQSRRWNAAERMSYDRILNACDKKIVLNPAYIQGCYHQRNRYMVDHSSLLICFYDGGRGGTAYTVNYAKEKQLEISNLYR